MHPAAGNRTADLGASSYVELQDAGVAADRQDRAVRAERHHQPRGAAGIKWAADSLSASGIPELSDADPVNGGQDTAVRTQRNCDDTALTSDRESSANLPAGSHVPQLGFSIVGTCGRERAVGIQRHRNGKRIRKRGPADQVTAGEVPDVHRTVASARDEPGTGSERRGVLDSGPSDVEGSDLLAGCHVPALSDAVRGGCGQGCAV